MGYANFRVAIPSYKRPQLIQELTLNCLAGGGIPDSSVDVFVSSQEEADVYRAALAGREITVVYETPLNDLREKFNFIHLFYAPGTNVVVFEDDIKNLSYKAGENKLEPFTDFANTFAKAFKLCSQNNTKLWGISPYSNAFYMKPGASFGLKFIVANVFGFVSTNDPELLLRVSCKSDYERTLLNWAKFGALVRLDGLCAITKNYDNAGGLTHDVDEDGRKQQELASCRYLTKRFGHLISLNENKESRYPELKIRTIRKDDQGKDWRAIQQEMDRENGF